MKIRAHKVKDRVTAYYRGRRFILPSEVIARADLTEMLARMPVRGQPSQARAFLASFDVMPETWINTAGDLFRVLIQPKIHFLLLTLAFIGGALLPVLVDAYGHVPIIKIVDLQKASGIGWAAISAFLGVSFLLILHEFGHAAACRKVGVRADCMGIGFYLILPAFYTKLSLVTLLSRRERIIVWTSGVYFQMIASIGLALAALILGERALLTLAHLNNFTVLFNLMPVARFDGYKILSEFSDWVDTNDRFRLVKSAVVVTTVAYFLYAGRTLLGNIRRLLEGVLQGVLTPSTFFVGGLSCLGLIFFTLSLFRMLKGSLTRA